MRESSVKVIVSPTFALVLKVDSDRFIDEIVSEFIQGGFFIHTGITPHFYDYLCLIA